jgi:hypothetical protein
MYPVLNIELDRHAYILLVGALEFLLLSTILGIIMTVSQRKNISNTSQGKTDSDESSESAQADSDSDQSSESGQPESESEQLHSENAEEEGGEETTLLNTPLQEIDTLPSDVEDFRDGWNASWGVEPYPNEAPILPPAPILSPTLYPVGTRLRFVNNMDHQGIVVSNGMFFPKSKEGWTTTVKLEDWIILANTVGDGVICIRDYITPGPSYVIDTVGDDELNTRQNMFTHEQIWGWSAPSYTYTMPGQKNEPLCECKGPCSIPLLRSPTASDFTNDKVLTGNYD